MKVVFLDIDGVLNWQDFMMMKCKGSSSGSCEAVDPACVARLDRICSASKAKVVMSSSWRYFMSPQRLAELLQSHGFHGEVIGATPKLSGIRGDEIQLWLDQHQKVETFCILDDDSDMGEVLMPKLVKTTFAKGLLDEHVQQALALLIPVGAP